MILLEGNNFDEDFSVMQTNKSTGFTRFTRFLTTNSAGSGDSNTNR